MAYGCYTPAYLPASFNGVPFHAVSAESEHGRRGAEGEFPFGENTGYVDMGRKIRRYSLTARLQTSFHLVEAAALIAACERPGPGTLIHPTRGVLSAACVSIKVRDEIEEQQGITLIDLQFVEGNAWPSGLAFSGFLNGVAPAALLLASRVRFSAYYAPRSVIAFRVSATVSETATVFGTYRDQYSKSIADTGTSTKWRVASDLSRLAAEPNSLRDPDEVGILLEKSNAAVASEVSGQAQYEAFRRIANSVALNSPLSGVAGTSVEALYSYVRTSAAIYMVDGILEEPAGSFPVAIAQHDSVMTILDEEEDIAFANCDNVLFDEIRSFKSDASYAMLRVARGLPAEVTYQFGGGVSALKAAYEIYGDSRRFKEIEKRNIGIGAGRVGPSVQATS